ncbi:ATP-dependent DNA ligase [Jatrophihabitans telluris]|uniref:Probable DNA ligase n=1 Tax=Jatrophihabitans telluris TaxID=2038343 RepID=A0ABY4QWK5_9ACTN|nr:ATP-dependent DNA ligase [Jatrophihabitans telluris]UQX87360.1 ATP-dependent DNA ligase [Jatrophihabitans telluris]
MMLADLAATSDQLGATAARSSKVAMLVGLLGRASPDEIGVVVSWLSGELTQGQIGVGYAALRALPTPAVLSSMDVLGVQSAFDELGGTAGAGSQSRRRALLEDLFGAATAVEQAFLRRLLSGDLRQGALIGVMTDAVAKASSVPLTDLRRAAMLSGNLAEVARRVRVEGAESLREIGLRVGRPVGPMLASSVADPLAALDKLGGDAAFEWKLDGARVQIHRHGAEVGLFTRSLDDVTARMPEVVEAIRALPVHDLVADGEVISLREDGRPNPFQVTASRFGTRRAAAGQADVPLTAFLFDLLHLDGRDLLDEPGQVRYEALASIVPDQYRVPRLVTSDAAAAGRFLADALARGHEGVMAKSLTAPYEAGRRGAGWLKIKPVHTLDLVVLAVEWGSGRRKGWLSNIHLGAREPDSGRFVMLGKTFKGMTDEMLAWQTQRFTQLATGPMDQWVVPVRPEQVVEIAFDGIQRSTRYPGGVALRFARVLRYRDDKSAEEADTVAAVRAFLPAQGT